MSIWTPPRTREHPIPVKLDSFHPGVGSFGRSDFAHWLKTHPFLWEKTPRNSIRFGSNVEVRSEMDEESFEFLTWNEISPEQKPLKRGINSSRCTGCWTFHLKRHRHGVSIQRGRMARGNGESMNPILKRVTMIQLGQKLEYRNGVFPAFPKRGISEKYRSGTYEGEEIG